MKNRFIENESFPEEYWAKRLKKSGNTSKDLLYWNLKAIENMTPHLIRGANVMLGFFGDAFPISEVQQFAQELKDYNYQLGYVDFANCDGHGIVQGFEKDTSLKLSIEVFEQLKKDRAFLHSGNVFDKIVTHFITKIISESKTKATRIDIRKNSKVLLSYTIKGNIDPDLLRHVMWYFHQMVTSHVKQVKKQVHYVLSKNGNWNPNHGVGIWRYQENFWQPY